MNLSFIYPKLASCGATSLLSCDLVMRFPVGASSPDGGGEDTLPVRRTRRRGKSGVVVRLKVTITCTKRVHNRFSLQNSL
jgi:hypothetical protein